jgi:sulfatase maturation enzyme AslB (radical SAM superfamily)
MYKNIKSADNFDKVIESLKALVVANGLDRLRIGVAYIITPESIDGIVEATELIGEIGGIDYLQFKDVLNRGVTFDEEYRSLISYQISEAKFKASFPVFYTTHNTTMKHKQKNCLSTNYVSVLGADGNVYSCCHLEYLPKYSCGSVYDKSFNEIWANKPDMKIDEKLCWNCRFMKTNDILHELDNIQDEDFV